MTAWRHPDNPFRVEGESEEDTFSKAIAVFQQQEKELVAKRRKEKRTEIIGSAISGGGIGLVIGFFLSALIGWEGALASTLMESSSAQFAAIRKGYLPSLDPIGQVPLGNPLIRARREDKAR